MRAGVQLYLFAGQIGSMLYTSGELFVVASREVSFNLLHT